MPIRPEERAEDARRFNWNVAAFFMLIASIVAFGAGCSGMLRGLNNVDNGGSTAAAPWTGPAFVLWAILGVSAVLAWALHHK